MITIIIKVLAIWGPCLLISSKEMEDPFLLAMDSILHMQHRLVARGENT
jgi:hypothetical protein